MFETYEGWAIVTVLYHLAVAVVTAYVGYRMKAKADEGIEWDGSKATPTVLIGLVIGALSVVTGSALDTEAVVAVTGVAVPIVDKLWKTGTDAVETAADMHGDGDSLTEIAVEVRDILGRDVDREEVAAVVGLYEAKFGELPDSPDEARENLQERTEDVEEAHERGGVPEGAGEVIDGGPLPEALTIEGAETEPEVEDLDDDGRHPTA